MLIGYRCDTTSRVATTMSDHDLSLFRFSLRQLLAFFVIASAFFAVLAVSSLLTATLIVFGATVVGAHVFATVVGTRLQAQTNSANPFKNDRRGSAAANPPDAAPFHDPKPLSALPRSPWHVRGGTEFPKLRRLVAGAAILGGCLGACCLAIMASNRVSPVGIAVCGCSFAVLCGWFAFLISNFYSVFRRGFRDATMHRDSNIA